MWNVEHFIPRTKWEYIITLFLFNHYTNGLAGTIKEEKVIKSIKIEKEVKLSLFSDDITVDIRITKIKSIKIEKEVKLSLFSDDITVDIRITKNL